LLFKMNTSNNDKTAFLASSNDWESWNLQFQAQAVAGDIWAQIQGLTPFLDKPTAPALKEHKHTTPSSTVESTPGNDPDTGTLDRPLNPPIKIADLTTDGFRSYQMEWTIYQSDLKEYNQQVEEVKKLKQWILRTVNPHYQLTSCDPTKPVSEWYSALKIQNGVSDQKALQNAREVYRLAIKPITRASKDLIKWSESWEQALALAQRKGVPEALSMNTWFTDFLDAVKPVLSNWVTVYKIANQAQAEQLTLTYRKVANDFREEVRQEMKARGTTRVVKGSFGPSFAATITCGEEAYQGDASDSGDGSGSNGGEQVQKRKRGGSEKGERPSKKPKKAQGTAKISGGKRPNKGPEMASGTASTTCPCCGQFHRLAKCYYAFPELAPDSFEGREHIRARAKEALLDPKLQKEVEDLKRQRQRQNPQH
jgi:hypothetical protein